jgi:ABC-type transport system involved in multi-copper enzyme maturation permease subunit
MSSILRAMLWKEWRESRLKWAVLLFVFHIPILPTIYLARQSSTLPAVRAAIGAQHALRTGLYIVPCLMVQSIFIVTVGLFLAAFYATSTVSPEIESHRIFFLLERPVRRWWVLLVKFSVGALGLITCVGSSMLASVTIGYCFTNPAEINASAGELRAAYVDVIGSAMRGTFVVGTVAVAVFAAAFFLSIVFSRLWAAVAAAGICLVVVLYALGETLLRLIADGGSADNRELITGSHPFNRVKPLVIILMIVLAAGFYLVAQVAFSRKQLK